MSPQAIEVFMEDACKARPLSPYRARVLIVEDDADVKAPLERIMRRAGFATLVAETAEEAVLLAESALPDLMLLDLMLPDAHGAQVISQLEGHRIRPPVIVVTGVGAFAEQRRMFGLGVRDYIIKPFDIYDLLIRVEGVLLSEVARTRLHRGGMVLDWQRFTVRCGSYEKVLSPRVFQLLLLLLARIGQEVSWLELKQRLWMHADDVLSNTLHVHVSRLRRVLRDANAPLILHNTRGRGVVLDQVHAQSNCAPTSTVASGPGRLMSRTPPGLGASSQQTRLPG